LCNCVWLFISEKENYVYNITKTYFIISHEENFNWNFTTFHCDISSINNSIYLFEDISERTLEGVVILSSSYNSKSVIPYNNKIYVS
jgi:hypothetical protein